MRTLGKRILLAFAIGAALASSAAALAALAWRELNAPLPIAAEGAWIEVTSGTSLRRVTRALAERGLLDSPWLLAAYGRATGEATRIHAGEYLVLPGTTPVSLLAKLVRGEVYLHQVTIVEGTRFADLLTAVRSHPAIAAGSLDGAAIMAALGAPEVHPEGQFFPDTYRFPKGTLDIEILRLAHDALSSRLEVAWRSRAPDLVLQNSYEALILASIIEKETALASERPRIAGVHARLRRNMRLQTDPTVIYGLGERFDGNLRKTDLLADAPYNTYTRGGLPPTPICLPGRAASIAAAVAPEISDAIYFVATGNGDGSHYFSATLEEHERAVRAYLRQLRSQDP